jgi:dTDP-glucose 4,6-dehydratase
MRIVITGGAGFIGSHLCDYFINHGDSVVCIDNLLTGSLNNIKHLRKNRKFTFIKHDVTKYIDVSGHVDAVMDLASPASPKDYYEFPIQTLKAGALGTHNALGLAKKKKARFLLTSTSEVYGDPLVHPQKESYWGHVNPIGPRSVYDEAKRFAEAITMSYHRYHNVDTRIARIFNTYGPRMRLNDGRVLPNFFSQALSGKGITIFGNGKQTRSFCYVADMVAGLVKLLNSKEHYPVNLGNPSEITMLQLAREILELTGAKSKIIFKPLPEDDPKQRKPDISKAKRILNWAPKVSRKEGFKETLIYFSRIRELK